MLEGLVAWVLNNYLGKYVENLNTDQLSVALLSGKVELENLPLKKDALRHLGLPVEIKAGFIGKVQLQVPVRQIRSAPWLISIHKLYLVAAPVNVDEWDAGVEAMYAHERKVGVLEGLEATWRAAHELPDAEAGYYAASYSSWLSYGTGLLANIVENLQLTLSDVHLRYEDAVTCAPSAFAAGLTVESLVADSCDACWRRGFTLLRDPDGCSFKLLELNQLAVYWDSMQVPGGMFADCQLADLTERMSETWKGTHRYILPAVGAQARVRRERTELPLRSRTRPRLAAHLTIDSVPLTLTSRQYGEAIGCWAGLERVSRLREHRALRPAVPVAGHARDWWLYALQAHLPHHHWTEPRPTWESCVERARAARQYVDICLVTLTNPAATLSPDLKATKDEYEWRTDLVVLKALREVAMRKVPLSTPGSTPEKPSSSSGRGVLVHWFPQWWGWYGPAETTERAATPATATANATASPDLEEEILDVIADSFDNNTLLKRDTVFGKFEFALGSGSLVLRMEEEGGGGELELQFSALSACLESRPRAGSHALTVALGALALHDRVTPHTLFPIVCAPQGVIREGLSASAAGSTARYTAPVPAPAPAAPRPALDEPLFQLAYEKKPFGLACDYKLWVKSGSIEIVYNAGVAEWARRFVDTPCAARAAAAASAAQHTARARLRDHWQHMLRAGDRRTVLLELDVSAPQILVAEALSSRDAAVLLVDFGRLRLSNAGTAPAPTETDGGGTDSPATLDEETFATPCSTPPGSPLSPAAWGAEGAFDAASLRDHLYDRYSVELSSLQVLVGRARDNWQYAHTKATSSLHLLDRFSISVALERRVLPTRDPLYPTATVAGSLPALSVHLSEQKLRAVRAVLANLPPYTYNYTDTTKMETSATGSEEAPSTSEAGEAGEAGEATLVAVQFGVEQLSLEVQSRGRSIAEVQVCGVRAALQYRAALASLALSVHSLLLVDALQTYGPDFELLVASHKHVGMDTASGSIRGSEPASPLEPRSPASPTQPVPAAPPPHALTRALHASLYRAAATDEEGAWSAAGVLDSEALIAVELCFVRGDADTEDVHIANILFNNLDIIANQETIVELIGFAQRVSAGGAPPPPAATPPAAGVYRGPGPAPVPPAAPSRELRTEITFDFHRLGVLLLRAALDEDGALVARKIATATVSEAKIQATVAESAVSVSGSLGGVQVVSLCEGGGGLHTRVVSAGGPGAGAAGAWGEGRGVERALLFALERRGAAVTVSASVARVWYTHSPALLAGLHSCLAEFKQYLANLARSIRAAAADMALGLVHPREAVSDGGAGSSSGGGRRRTVSIGASLDEGGAGAGAGVEVIELSVSVELQSPVVIVPRAAASGQVLLAHLGRMSLSNRPGPPTDTTYRVRIRDVSLVSLDVTEKLRRFRLTAETMPQVYEAGHGKPVLHETALQVSARCTGAEWTVEGGVVGALQVSARREQYDQLLETVRFVSAPPAPEPAAPRPPPGAPSPGALEPAVPTLQHDPAVRAAVLIVPPPLQHVPTDHVAAHALTDLTVRFSVAVVGVELRADLGEGERSLVGLSCREFVLVYRRPTPLETTLQVALHSVTMEDLTKAPDAPHRTLLVSHTPPHAPKAVFLSKSCPDLQRADPRPAPPVVRSLPDHLNRVLEDKCGRQAGKCGPTPPCSPECGASPAPAGGAASDEDEGDAEQEEDEEDEPPVDDNLVCVWVHTRDPTHPRFHDTFNKVSKLTKIEFNRLNVVVSVDSWVAVLDFFGIAGDDEPEEGTDEVDGGAGEGGSGGGAGEGDAGVTQVEMSIRSLSVAVVGARGEVCRAHVSRVAVAAEADPARRTRRIVGRLGALTVAAPTAAPAWRTALRTHSRRALAFTYRRLAASEAAAAGHDTALSVDLAPVTYVHTKRLVHELRVFAREFSLLRRVIAQARRQVSVGGEGEGGARSSRMLLALECATPSIVVPVSGRSRSALVVRLARLRLDNTFRMAGSPGTVSSRADPDGPREQLDVRTVRLESLALHGAEGAAGGDGERGLDLGAPLLTAPAHLTLQIEYNMTDTHNVADMTVQGTLTTLEVALDAERYRLVRGVLAHNLGEAVEEEAAGAAGAAGARPVPATPAVWTASELRFELQDVRLRLHPERAAPPLACVNFIKSRLVVDTYSDGSQDVDLVSQEILVSDARYEGEPANRRGNVFTHIVQPMAESGRHSVQAEVHARRRADAAAYTVLVNNMRLMAVLEWWERAHAFLSLEPLPAGGSGAGGAGPAPLPPEPPPFDLKLNVTDSQLVFVEEPSVWDTNAVILRGTAVLAYRPAGDGSAAGDPPLSCSLTDLEVFSCVLGLEEETALAILEPAALHVTVDAERVLHVAMNALDLRLSYHDMRMFAAMLRSLPVQARAALAGEAEGGAPPPPPVEDAPANSVHMRRGTADTEPRWMMAPRWLRRTPPAPPPPLPARTTSTSRVWPLKAVKVSAECITLCVIDDCLDSDVPLLEVQMSRPRLERDLRDAEEGFEDPVLVSTPGSGSGVGVSVGVGVGSRRTSDARAGAGRLRADLAVDYYNRTLSGWEPLLEPWPFAACWEHTLSGALARARLHLELESPAMLDLNLTSSLIELAQLVRSNWAADLYASPPPPTGGGASPKGSPAGHRRRSPFVPYALRNLTGHRVWFTTLVVSAEQVAWGARAGPDDSWQCARAGDTEPFSFGARWGRALARRPALHQLALRLDSWLPPEPVCVDRVGVFFRDLVHEKSGAEARLVFEVSLEGSARKLVTVRSALQLINKLPHPVEVRVDNAAEGVGGGGGRAWRAACTACVVACARRAAAALPHRRARTLYTDIGQWRGGSGASWTVAAGERWAAPLAERAGVVWARPLVGGGVAPPAPAALDWRSARPLVHAECRAPPHHVYRFCCAVVREPFPAERGAPLAGHTLTLVPALRLENLLPLELQVRVSTPRTPLLVATPPGDTTPFHQVDVEEGVELSVKLEGFGWSTPVSVGGPGAQPGQPGSFTARLKLRDTRARRLYLNARVITKKTDGVKVSVSAAYWLVNRTGLPLVFRAEGSATEAAGQFEEHEVARMVAPLLFSFAETDGGGPTLAARLGRATGRGPPGAFEPAWCSPFGLGPGVAVKKLETRGEGEGGGERVYAVGVSVRAGRGRYRHTNIVTFTPRYQLHNNTSHRLQFAQKCCATTLTDPGAAATHVSAVAGCYLPWHWARWERERLVCVRVLETGGAGEPRTAWSGGFRVDAPRALTVPCRELHAPHPRYVLVRVEVAAQGASLLVVLTDAEAAPPPIALHNLSPVAIMFHQAGSGEECVASAASRAHWALPEPEGAAAVSLRAPGSSRATLVNLADLGSTYHLVYQNFIYVVFTATLTGEESSMGERSGATGGVDDNVLVLEVPLGTTRVVLARKKYGDRSQLWRRGPNDQLIHEGSSVPTGADGAASDEAPLSPHTMVLDIEDAAPRPGRAAPLVLRRADPRRASTQAWRLRAGRMQCVHSNLCVQPEGQTLLALAPGVRLVLALAGRGGDRVQAVAWHSLRPGSGRLAVTLTADGPTRLLTVRDTRDSTPGGTGLEAGGRARVGAGGAREWGLRVALAGLGVSLVARTELVYAAFSGVALELGVTPASVAVALAVTSMQWDNQLADTPSPVLLYCVSREGGAGAAPALHAAAELQRAPEPRYNAYFFRHMVVALRPLAVRLEERLLLLLWAWAGADDGDAREQPDEVEFETRRMLDELTALHATRYYFALIKIMPSQIRLSMMTASKLEGSLSSLKRRLGLTLIKFEDAAVELEPFVRAHVFDTANILARQLLAHFKDELKWQAAKILGSVDFLGNPLGFVADVSEGVSGLLLEGNVGALLKNVTHGISNSAAKVTESLGDGLERVVGDEAHEETRRRIRSEASGAHLAAGLRGLGLGILGGVTSLVKHSYEGAAQEGFGGFLAGVGKGLVGTVTKPVIGVLDLAAETASALRETSRRADRWVPARVRPPRGAAGRLLARYDAEHARGAQLLQALAGAGAGAGERFLAWRTVRDAPHDIRALLSDAYLRIVTCKHAPPHVVMETHLGNLVSCTAVAADGAHYVELAVRGGGGGGGEAVRRPRVQTDSPELAAWVVRHAAYAKQLYHEHLHTLHPVAPDD